MRSANPTVVYVSALNLRPNDTANDQLNRCFNLAKPSRNRQQRHGTRRNNQLGRIDTCLAGQLALLAVIALLFARGVIL